MQPGRRYVTMAGPAALVALCGLAFAGDQVHLPSAPPLVDLDAAEPSRQAPAAPDETADEIWSSRCGMCHGPAGDGQTTMGRRHAARDLTDPAWQAGTTDERIACIILHGVPGSPMRAFQRHLNPAQVKALVRRVRSFGIEGAFGGER
jgi:mono/diheme cytochrome c family protein